MGTTFSDRCSHSSPLLLFFSLFFSPFLSFFRHRFAPRARPPFSLLASNNHEHYGGARSIFTRLCGSPVASRRDGRTRLVIRGVNFGVGGLVEVLLVVRSGAARDGTQDFTLAPVSAYFSSSREAAIIIALRADRASFYIHPSWPRIKGESVLNTLISRRNYLARGIRSRSSPRRGEKIKIKRQTREREGEEGEGKKGKNETRPAKSEKRATGGNIIATAIPLY